MPNNTTIEYLLGYIGGGAILGGMIFEDDEMLGVSLGAGLGMVLALFNARAAGLGIGDIGHDY